MLSVPFPAIPGSIFESANLILFEKSAALQISSATFDLTLRVHVDLANDEWRPFPQLRFGSFKSYCTIQPVSACCASTPKAYYNYVLSTQPTFTCSTCGLALDGDEYGLILANSPAEFTGSSLASVEAWLVDRIGTLESVLLAPLVLQQLGKYLLRFRALMDSIGSEIKAYIEIFDDLLSSYSPSLLREKNYYLPGYVKASSCPVKLAEEPPMLNFQIFHSPEFEKHKLRLTEYRAKSRARLVSTRIFPDGVAGRLAYASNSQSEVLYSLS